MHCAEVPANKAWRQATKAALTLMALLLASCGGNPPKEYASAPAPKPGKPVTTPGATYTAPGTNIPVTNSKGVIRLPAPEAPRNWADARQQAAKRLVAANPDITYMGKPPDILLAIPVMSIELNADGSIRNISVLRYPSQARETVDTAIAALRRAAPFGDVSRLPKPWKFNETFLFRDDRKFKPMTLDQP